MFIARRAAGSKKGFQAILKTLVFAESEGFEPSNRLRS